MTQVHYAIAMFGVGTMCALWGATHIASTTVYNKGVYSAAPSFAPTFHEGDAMGERQPASSAWGSTSGIDLAKSSDDGHRPYRSGRTHSTPSPSLSVSQTTQSTAPSRGALIHVEGAGYLCLPRQQSTSGSIPVDQTTLERARSWALSNGEPFWIQSPSGEIMVLIDYSNDEGPIYAKL